MRKLPREVKDVIHVINGLSSMVALGGSWATGENNLDSDVDLVVICANERDKKEVSRLVYSGKNIVGDRILVDVKLYTEDEFQNKMSGKDNLYLYSFFQEAVIIHGEMKQKPKMLKNIIRDKVNDSIMEIEQSINDIESEVKLEAACFRLYAGLITFHIAKGLLKDTTPTKSERKELHKKFLGKNFDGVKRGYEEVRWMMFRRGMDKKIVIKWKKRVKQLRDVDLGELLKSARRILDYGQNVYRMYE